MFDIRKIILYFIIPLIIILNFFFLFSSYYRTGKLERSILKHSDIQREEIEIIKDVLMKSTDDLNQTRSLLNLPVKNFSFEYKKKTDSEISNDEDFKDNLIFYQGIETLLTNYRNTSKRQAVSDFINNNNVQNIINYYGFVIEEDSNDILIKYKNKTAYKINPEFEGSNYVIIISLFDATKRSEITPGTMGNYIDETINSLKQRIDLNLDEINNLNAVISRNDLKRQFTENKIYLSKPEKSNDEYIVNIYNILRDTGEVVAAIKYNEKTGRSILAETAYESSSDLIADLFKIEEIIDLRTSAEKKIETAFKEISEVIQDPAFSSYITDKGFRLNPEHREGADYYYFDLLTLKGTGIIGSFGVHKQSGEIYLFDSENVMVSSLNFINDISKKKI